MITHVWQYPFETTVAKEDGTCRENPVENRGIPSNFIITVWPFGVVVHVVCDDALKQ